MQSRDSRLFNCICNIWCLNSVRARPVLVLFFFFLNDPAPTEFSPLPLPDALPICAEGSQPFLSLRNIGQHQRVIPCLIRRHRADQHRRKAPSTHLQPECLVDAQPELPGRSEEHTSELQSQSNLVCRLLLEKKKKKD